jgi:hypothetical protein
MSEIGMQGSASSQNQAGSGQSASMQGAWSTEWCTSVDAAMQIRWLFTLYSSTRE